MRLTIVIPAYNEEEAIATICSRTLAARQEIIKNTPVTEVNVVVVNDGSSDDTAKIGSSFSDITLISYKENKGYGAAIKLGFSKTNDELVSFLDADGTCDPLFFIPLINEMLLKNFDIILGSRMSKESRMPLTRRIGNVLFATLLTLLSGSTVKDTASGMRVIRRSALPILYPLPDGLHFTPAMSAKAIFNKNLSIGELPMPYEERVGQSKLNPLKDGLRFLRVIIETAVQYKPDIFFNVTAGFCFILAILLAFTPLSYVLIGKEIEDWMIYRNLTAFVLVNAGTILFATGQNAQGFLKLIYYRHTPSLFFEGKETPNGFLNQHGFLLGFISLIVSGFILFNPFLKLVKTGNIDTDWWVFLFGLLFFLLGFIFISTGALGIILKLLSIQLVDQAKIEN
jgi:glycosyltransferase involved in cell wall biosynthesis